MDINILSASVQKSLSTSHLGLESRRVNRLPKVVPPPRTVITATTTVTRSFKSSVWKRFLTYYWQPPVSAHASEMHSEVKVLEVCKNKKYSNCKKKTLSQEGYFKFPNYTSTSQSPLFLMRAFLTLEICSLFFVQSNQDLPGFFPKASACKQKSQPSSAQHLQRAPSLTRLCEARGLLFLTLCLSLCFIKH